MQQLSIGVLRAKLREQKHYTSKHNSHLSPVHIFSIPFAVRQHLELPPSALAPLHAVSLSSGDHIRFVRAPPQPPSDSRTALGAHTDFGSLTLLFNRLGGLQVLLPRTTTWSYVRPLPGHAIVNLGDALVKFWGGILRSNLQRVVAPPGEQARETPGDEVVLRRVEGGLVPALMEGEVEEAVTSKGWIGDKAQAGKIGATGAGGKRVTNDAELGDWGT